jgi:hypothetical protein
VIKLTYNSGCRLGNRLFMYAAGRLLARKLGIPLQSEPLDGFPRTRDVISGKSLTGLVHDISSADPIPEWPQVGRLIGEPLEVKHGFVNSRYFVDDRDTIKSWFRLESPIQPDPDDVLVNVRLREFVDLGLALDPSYYTTVLQQLKFKKLYVMTDEPRSPYLEFLDQYSPEYISGTPVEHFAIGSSFKRIVMSNSTFCWWFTFVTDATEIYFPMINGNRCGSWCLGALPTIDLRLDWPEVTTVYNIPNWKSPMAGPNEYDIKLAMLSAVESKILFL